MCCNTVSSGVEGRPLLAPPLIKSILLCLILIEMGVPMSAPASAPWESPATPSSSFLGAVSGPMSHVATVEAFIVLRVKHCLVPLWCSGCPLVCCFPSYFNRASCLCCKLLFTHLSSSLVAVFFSCCRLYWGLACFTTMASRVTPSDA